MKTTENKYTITEEPTIRVGIVDGPTVRVSTPGGAVREVGRAEVDAAGGELRPTLEMAEPQLGEAEPGEAAFELCDVAIGIGFHWERLEPQRFEGSLLLRSSADNDTDIIAINEIGVEAYLRSVVCSEMKADAPEEFLKAHAITSRSWLLRQLADVGKHPQGRCSITGFTVVNDRIVDELVCWHDREDHTQFDVCADDHCQRYQGLGRRTTAAARAVDATRGIEAQDANIFGLIQRNKKGLVVCVNKWDIAEDKSIQAQKHFEEAIRNRFAPFTDFPIIFCSALTKQRIFKVIETAVDVYRNRRREVPTSQLNKVMLEAIGAYPPPANKGKYIKIKYVTQLPTPTPQFAFFVNLPQYIKEPYRRFLENNMRDHWDFSGVPVQIYFRQK